MSIDIDHYRGFKNYCDRNPKLHCPTKTQLEDSGCQISDTFYLVEPSGRVVNPATVNPEILEDSIKNLFMPGKPIELVYETNGKDEFKDSPVPMPDLNEPTKQCTHCSMFKPLDHFGKKRGPGKQRKEVCTECEEKIKAQTIGDITGLSHEKPNAEPIGKEELGERIKEMLTEEKEPQEERSAVGDQPDNHPDISWQHAQRLALEAYQLGIIEGERRATSTTAEPTLSDLLGKNWTANSA